MTIILSVVHSTIQVIRTAQRMISKLFGYLIRPFEGSTTKLNKLKSYGPVALLTYSGISCISVTGWFLALYAGMPIAPLIQKLDRLLPWRNGEEDSTSGTGGTADTSNSKKAITVSPMTATLVAVWSVHSLIFPLRVAAAASLTPMVARAIRKRNYDQFVLKKFGIRILP